MGQMAVQYPSRIIRDRMARIKCDIVLVLQAPTPQNPEWFDRMNW